MFSFLNKLLNNVHLSRWAFHLFTGLPRARFKALIYLEGYYIITTILSTICQVFVKFNFTKRIIGVFAKWSRIFIEFRESDKSPKHELGSI